MATSKGHPFVTFRMHPEAVARMKEKAERALPGRRGGVGAYLRSLVYQDLDFPGSGEFDRAKEEK